MELQSKLGVNKILLLLAVLITLSFQATIRPMKGDKLIETEDQKTANLSLSVTNDLSKRKEDVLAEKFYDINGIAYDKSISIDILQKTLEEVITEKAQRDKLSRILTNLNSKVLTQRELSRAIKEAINNDQKISSNTRPKVVFSEPIVRKISSDPKSLAKKLVDKMFKDEQKLNHSNKNNYLTPFEALQSFDIHFPFPSTKQSKKYNNFVKAAETANNGKIYREDLIDFFTSSFERSQADYEEFVETQTATNVANSEQSHLDLHSTIHVDYDTAPIVLSALIPETTTNTTQSSNDVGSLPSREELALILTRRIFDEFDSHHLGFITKEIALEAYLKRSRTFSAVDLKHYQKEFLLSKQNEDKITFNELRKFLVEVFYNEPYPSPEVLGQELSKQIFEEEDKLHNGTINYSVAIKALRKHKKDLCEEEIKEFRQFFITKFNSDGSTILISFIELKTFFVQMYTKIIFQKILLSVHNAKKFTEFRFKIDSQLHLKVAKIVSPKIEEMATEFARDIFHLADKKNRGFISPEACLTAFLKLEPFATPHDIKDFQLRFLLRASHTCKEKAMLVSFFELKDFLIDMFERNQKKLEEEKKKEEEKKGKLKVFKKFGDKAMSKETLKTDIQFPEQELKNSKQKAVEVFNKIDLTHKGVVDSKTMLFSFLKEVPGVNNVDYKVFEKEFLRHKTVEYKDKQGNIRISKEPVMVDVISFQKFLKEKYLRDFYYKVNSKAKYLTKKVFRVFNKANNGVLELEKVFDGFLKEEPTENQVKDFQLKFIIGNDLKNTMTERDYQHFVFKTIVNEIKASKEVKTQVFLIEKEMRMEEIDKKDLDTSLIQIVSSEENELEEETDLDEDKENDETADNDEDEVDENDKDNDDEYYDKDINSEENDVNNDSLSHIRETSKDNDHKSSNSTTNTSLDDLIEEAFPSNNKESSFLETFHAFLKHFKPLTSHNIALFRKSFEKMEIIKDYEISSFLKQLQKTYQSQNNQETLEYLDGENTQNDL